MIAETLKANVVVYKVVWGVMAIVIGLHTHYLTTHLPVFNLFPTCFLMKHFR